MIVGRGSISQLLNDREGVRFFAKGISNSLHDGDAKKEAREFAEVCIQIGIARAMEEMFVYFSTISVFLTETPYTKHKTRIEKIIKDYSPNYTIIRLGNIWECTNPNTFRNKMRTWGGFEVRKEYQDKIREENKYMISRDQLQFITDNLPLTGGNEISIFGEIKTVSECLKR